MDASDRNRVIAADIIAKAMQDSTFKSEFVSNPKKILQDSGMDNIPELVNLRVLANTAEKKYVVIPHSTAPSLIKDQLIDLLRQTLPAPLPEGVEITIVQNTANLQHILIPVIPASYTGEFTASHLELLAAAGWEAINLYTTANAVAEVNAAVWANVAAATEVGALAMAVVVVGIVLV